MQREFFEVRSAVRPSASSIAIAERILAHIALNFGEPVLALHLRRGDFRPVCNGALCLSYTIQHATCNSLQAIPAWMCLALGQHGDSHPDIYLAMRQVGGSDCYPTVVEISEFVRTIVAQVRSLIVRFDLLPSIQLQQNDSVTAVRPSCVRGYERRRIGKGGIAA
jgi:hypothetical protein